MNAPILICGCPGSGTSLVAKILRHAGLFLGADAGPADARKYHESQCFKRYNIRFLDRTIGFPHAPKSVEQFQTHNSRMKLRKAQLVELVDSGQLLSEYWGDSVSQFSTQPWGWKDPRNSATAMIWQGVFPQLRVIVICRNWRWRDRWKSGGSESGNWYRKQSTAELRKLYEHPVGIDQNSLLRVDVDQLTTDANFLEQVLTWCNLSIDPRHTFDDFMEEIGLER
jgi:hypothetical protein